MHDLQENFFKGTPSGGDYILDEGALNIHEQPFSNYDCNLAKGQVMMAFASEKDTREDSAMQPEDEPDLNRMA